MPPFLVARVIFRSKYRAHHNGNMRLVTHNMLKSNVRGVSGGYPLVIEAEHIETRNSDVNPGNLAA